MGSFHVARLVLLASLPIGSAFSANAVAADELLPRRLSPAEQASHVLNRLAFGPGPGDLARLTKDGWQQWMEAQLVPQGIADEELDKLVADRFPSLKMSIREIYDNYWPLPPMNYDDLSEAEKDAFNERRGDLYQQIVEELQESVLVRALGSRRQFEEVMVEFWRNHFNVDQTKGECRFFANNYETQVIRKHAFGRFEDMLLASARHPAMSAYLDNEISQKPLTKRERETLDKIRKKRRANPEIQLGEYARNLERYMGLNENYARELMELHTLGVDRFYTQNDVREVARVLTGWTHGWVGEPYESEYGFRFQKDYHDIDAKKVLGRKIRGRGGEEEGLDVLRALARHDGTADFIAWKLCRYLVNDEPPKVLVDVVAKAFRKSRGHLPTVYRALLFHPLFFDRAHLRAKFKSPFEYVVSAVRATGSRIEDATETLYLLHRMGQPLYRCEDPTGYFDQTEAWLDPGVLVHRWDFALRMTRGKVKGLRFDPECLMPFAGKPAAERADAMAAWLFPGGLAPAALEVIRKTKKVNRQLGLLLGSPGFQDQ